ncbi:chorismate mutase [Peterkaempfera bronchialis]|uniref:Chorismate mutase n=1 Tax=Peterkaempfera bronchialis TaxID=2126346 RepID=A0A345SW69_9ACTN|nr:chorismate mutase [Peterkaempfera bronchialis]AXI77974.1 chorismate mutase [Peterkaempfera bronchialis]
MSSTTTAPASVPAPAPAHAPAMDPAEAAAAIASARARIDDLDARIIELVKQRMAASAEVQAARTATGGPRLALAREMEILERFRAELGRPGTEVAKLLLELCRGRV